MIDERTQPVIELMARYATADRRYLWTDAFAVTNYLGLALASGESRYLDDARSLIDRVHQSLARHRPDSKRRRWISGRSESDGAVHPTIGGLRIGKPQDERPAHEPLNERLEWDRDGQYFHYLTKWMHALDQTARVTGELWFNCWARELAVTARQAFVYTLLDGSHRMYWKMAIDLSQSRPLVPTMGQHDPLDGYVTFMQLRETALPENSCTEAPVRALESAVGEFADMIDPDRLATDDALGIGGLLMDAYRLAQLDPRNDLIETCLAAALDGLDQYAHWHLQTPLQARRRLPFRELGLAIGLAAVERMIPIADPKLGSLIGELVRYAPLRNALQAFWLQPENQRVDSWVEHADINTVMLATSLLPDGFLTLHRPRSVPFLNPVAERAPPQGSHPG